MLDARAQWIWINSNPQPNEYAIFKEKFLYSGGKAELKISAETDYIAYVNGKRVAFGQFAGYPNEKYYDTVLLNDFCNDGENELTITVRYEGLNSSIHIDDGAGVIFTIEEDGNLIAYSSEKTKGGFDGRYAQHDKRFITIQMGYTSTMQAEEPHDWVGCKAVEKNCKVIPCSVKKCILHPEVLAQPISSDNNIFDFGQEYTGYLHLKVKTKKQTKVKICYAECLCDGDVVYRISDRDFSLDFNCAEGENEFTQLFVRVAARYIKVICDDELSDLNISIIPYIYPLTRKPIKLEGKEKEIYDACVNTLRLCMHSHYEDCPWREQALYVLDSRNQMLCGYYAFEETEFQRANLVFISKGLRKEGVLELTFPAVDTPAIPFFSVMYPVAVYEYVKHTGDKTILSEVMDTVLTIMNTMMSRMDEKNLLQAFEAPFWNFYEWNDGVNGIKDGKYHNPSNQYELILNCAFVYSVEKLQKLCEMMGKDFKCDVEKIKSSIVSVFYNDELGLFGSNSNNLNHYTQLGNAFALLIGLGDNRTIQALKSDKLIPATLSMKGYVYDALLKTDLDNKNYVLQDIYEKYSYMLKRGTKTVWETIDSIDKVKTEGLSLCHGWSAMPVYYYHLLLKNLL